MNMKKEPVLSEEGEKETILLDIYPFRDSKLLKVSSILCLFWFFALASFCIYSFICDQKLYILAFSLLFLVYAVIVIGSMTYRLYICSDKIIHVLFFRKTTVVKPNTAAIEIKFVHCRITFHILDLEHDEKVVLTASLGDISPIKKNRLLLEMNGYAIFDSENILKKY